MPFDWLFRSQRMRAAVRMVSLGLAVGFCLSCAGPKLSLGRLVIPKFLDSPQLLQFGLADHSERRGIELWTFTNATSVLKIDAQRGLDVDSGVLLMNDAHMGIEALYANALSPYPGDISYKIATQKEYLPRSVEGRAEGVRRSGFLLFANDRMGYGATTAEQIRYKSIVLWVLCERSGTLYRLRWFLPMRTPDQVLLDLFNDVKCD